MKVRILVSIAGLDFSYAPGQIVDMPNEQASVWISGGNAEKFISGAEAAVSGSKETAIKPRAQKRRK